MKFKNKIFTLLSVFTLVGLTNSFTLKDLNAALTAPASFDINYRYNSVDDDTFGLGTTSWPTYFPTYTRTADGVYYNYSLTIDNSDTSILPLGLEITMTFNRSNSLWYSFGGGYLPDNTKIGSDNSVGSIADKLVLTFNNQTNKDYRLSVDFSSTTSQTTFLNLFYNIQYNYNSGLLFTTALRTFYIPSFTQLDLKASATNAAYYFDAWYLQDLGQSDSYDIGYYDGYDQGDLEGYADGLGNNPNILLNGFQAMVGILINIMLMILNLEVFGVSISSIFAILALFVGVIWILKIVRG
jgi:hypothetical protein